MQHSIVSRFEGALLGAVLGEVLGYYALTKAGQPREINRWFPGLSSTQAIPPSAIAPTLLANGNRLIQQSGQITQIEPPKQRDNAAILTLTNLPIVLLHHASDWQLEQQLSQLIESWQIPTVTGKAWLEMSQAIARVLRENCPTAEWLLNLTAALGLPKLEPETTLQGVNSTAEATQSRSLTALGGLHDLPKRVQQLIPDSQAEGATAVLLALVYFLRTPTNLPASLLAAAYAPSIPQLVCPLVGTFAGAMGGRASIPLMWSIHLEKTPLLGLYRADIHNLAQALFRSWAGVLSDDVQLEVAIAAPNIIRPRI
ncbi:MAG TPA: hypothetical protein IGS53_08425 [Leptolyngbyaceae cyanobacterium M33_DOE_097]|uniref:ADP-ribosylglycohydrolase family protein n=1 Tax=Oscillatoriales cyanobacterium SpSt-418 TaxID=2282169 RepID=A0A7C3PKT8_9CYAN|nr:hypothetical protein [Leptolyngbyaceae cyanobacterium M33_DOE_097]